METPVSLGGSSGATGIGVVPSDLSSTTMQQVFTGATTPTGLLGNFTLAGSTLTTYSPYAVAYEAADGTGLTQLYGLALADSSDSAPPVPGQIGALSQANVCYGNYHVGNTNLLQPTSAFFILQYSAPTGSCNAPTTVLMHWNDASGTAPTVVPAITHNTPSSNYADLYTFPSGQLYAEVLLTSPAGGDLNIYPAGTGGTPNFSAPQTVATGAQSVDHHAISLNRNGVASSTVLFSNVRTGSAYKLYRIDTSGNPAVAVYTPTVAAGTTHALQLTPTVVDNTYIYFIDITYTTLTGGVPGPPITYNFFKEPLDGSTSPVQIGTATEPQSGSPPDPFPYGITFALVDSDGSNLILESTNLTTSPPTFDLYELAVTGASSQSPSQLLPPYNATGAVAIVAFLDYASDHLFVNEISSTTTTSLVISPSTATTALPAAASTSFIQWAPTTVGNNHTVLQLQNLPTDGTQSGATLFNMRTDTFATTQFTLNGTASFFTVNPQSNVVLFPVSNTIGIGSSVGTSDVGLALDVSKNQINTIPVANTNVSPF